MGIFGRWVGVGIIGWVMMGNAWGQEAGGTELAEIVGRLGSADFLVREKAQKELEKVPAERVGELRELARISGDEEVKARLVRRVEEVEEDLAAQPGRISVEVKGGTLGEMAAAINKSMGRGNLVKVFQGSEAATRPAAEGKRFTVAVRNVGFWDVIGKLNAQSPVDVTTGGVGVVMREEKRGFEVVETAGLFQTRIALVRNAETRGLSVVKGTESWVLYTETVADPRLRVLKLGVKFTTLLDDAGNDLLAAKKGKGEEHEGTAGMGWTSQLEVLRPAHWGKRIVKMNWVVHAVVSVREERRVLEKVPEGKLSELALGQGVLGLERQGNQGLLIHLKGNGNGAAWPVELRLVDETGAKVLEMMASDGEGVGLGVRTGTWHGEVTSPLKVRELEEKMEARDVALPAWN